MPDLGNGSVFSQTDSSNASGTMPSWSGAAAPSTLDDAGRAFQGAVTREWNWRSYTLTAGGTADAKTLTYSVAPAAYYNGQRFAFIANTTNTTTATLNVNSLGAKTIKKVLGGTLTNLSASDMVSGMFVEVAYNTSNDCFVWVNSVAPLAVNSSGDVGIGRATSAGYKLQTSGTIGANDGTVEVFMAPVAASLASIIGNVSNHALVFYQNNAEAFRVDTSKNVLVTSSGGLGYGTGSGGGVTQLTSKTTAVTVNKTNGYILTSNSALGGGTSATFTVSNSTFAASDNVVLNSTNGNYSVRVANNNSGSFTITLKNETGGSLSDAVQIQFAIIKSVFA